MDRFQEPLDLSALRCRRGKSLQELLRLSSSVSTLADSGQRDREIETRLVEIRV